VLDLGYASHGFSVRVVQACAFNARIFLSEKFHLLFLAFYYFKEDTLVLEIQVE